jgi:hypothetical protein
VIDLLTRSISFRQTDHWTTFFAIRLYHNMPLPRKWATFSSCLIVGIFIWAMGPFFEVQPDQLYSPAISSPNVSDLENQEVPLLIKQTDGDKAWRPTLTPKYRPGSIKRIGEPYSKTIIVPKTQDDKVEWISENFGDDPNVHPIIYAVDDVTAEFHTPRNKGHEVIAYLSYIIENYSNLSDVNIFLHSHRFSWHNNDLLDNDAVQMIIHLSPERVQRVGYMNMRCHWSPGCPSVW